MSNNSTQRGTTLNSAYSTEQASYVVNGALALLLTIPAVTLNISVITQYHKLSTEERKRGSKYLIYQQAIVDLYNGLVPSPLLATGNIVYYTNIFERVTDEGEGFYPYWYIICSWTMLVSLLCNLSFSILLATDRLLAVSKPVYWYSHLKYGESKYRYASKVIWVCASVFAVGEVYGHSVQFSQGGGVEEARRAHLARTILCWFLTTILIIIWSLTFFKTFFYYDRTRRFSMQQQMLVTTSSPKQRSITGTSQESSTDTEFNTAPNLNLSTRKTTNCSMISPMNLRRPSVSPSAIYSSELKLIRVFATMFAFFLIGYVPILIYLTLRAIDSTRLSSNSESNKMLHMVNATGCTALVLASCLNPCVVLLHVDHFHCLCACVRRSTFKRIRRRSCSSFRTEMMSSGEQRKISETVR